MKNFIKIIGGILVLPFLFAGCNGLYSSDNELSLIKLDSSETLTVCYAGPFGTLGINAVGYSDGEFSFLLSDTETGDTMDNEIKEITLEDSFTHDSVSGKYLKISGTGKVTVKVYGRFNRLSYGDKAGIEFNAYVDGDSYEDVAFRDEGKRTVTETIIPASFTYVYMQGHVFSDENGNFVQFYIDCADENLNIYLSDFNVYAAENESLFGGATLYQLTSNRLDDTQQGYLIVTQNGKLVMIDGGQFFDDDVVSDLLHKFKCEVDYWFITHPHEDHIGAAISIMKNNPEIIIKNFCYSFPEIEWIRDKAERGLDAANAPAYTSEFLQLVEERAINVIEIAGGDVFNVDGIEIKVINDLLLCDSNPLNEASMVLKVFTANKSILFLGDAGPQLGNYLLENHYEDLKSDIVQMAHHGQSGVTEEVYRAIDPEICLWPTKDWVFNNRNGLTGEVNSGSLQTFQVRKWMDKLKVKYHYISKNGLVCLK